ncbi:AMP-binding protein [Bradyrhizobium sp. CCGUVB14]|uniref:AMP-binding protein n=1 Tax=Bradyrhizobium sp. CCGUVB14 TaxID=2949628 RepID=UPI0020B25C1A|nr:AMP-binding protein [Bradyrhizobium sp. CCGUVB14]MCP3440721.1 AMP-binding protein [Bradyrhizobium sp. CCGUVB14]
MQTIPQLLLARAQDSGDRVFCKFKGQQTTFRSLLAKVQEMAGALQEAGVKRGDRVGFMLTTSVEHIALYLATSWIGAAAVPFSVHLKSAGIELQVSSAKPSAFVANRVQTDAVRAAFATVPKAPVLIWFEDGDNRNSEHSLNDLLRASRSAVTPVSRSLDDLLAINYTSGTTGAPKGAMLSDRFYWIGAKNAGVLSEANRDDVFFLWEPFYHVAAWMTVMMALHHGLSIYMVERLSASKLWDQIADAKATKFHYLGGLINILLSQFVTESERNNTVSIAWGAACPKDTWRQFEERFGLIVREGYGLSEGQNFTHINMRDVLGSIGTPVEEFDSWLVDDHGDRVGPGVVGEIVLKPKMPGITMRGYFGDPEKTAEVLRADGCVYTGDTASTDQDGNFYFKGRKKDALRRRGENVSAWEVERVLNAAPNVEESAVLGVASPMGEQDILAVVKAKDGAEADPLTIAQFCSERLAYYQIPRYIQIVDEFPRGPTQRIKKNDIVVDLNAAWDAEKAGFKPARNV